MERVSVEIQGRTHEIPGGLTAIQALWHTGHEIVKGIGCLGGVCGACTFTYKRKGEAGMKTGLACQTPVENGMTFSLPVSIEVAGAHYRIQEIQDPQSELSKYYPETRRCTRCNACTLVCPQQIDVRACVVKALSGEFSDVSEMFYNCVMCGLCAAVCDVSVKPNRVGLYARRSQGSHLIPTPRNLAERLEEIAKGTFSAEWERVLNLDEKGDPQP